MKEVTNKLFTLGILVVFLSVLAGCKGKSEPEAVTPQEKVMLWNGEDFTGWKLFVADEKADVDDIWSVKSGVVHCKGIPNGYMRTERKYANYQLHVEWRWAGKPTNSGVLLHSSGPDKVWPRTIEAQLQAGNAGDFVLINGTGITVDGEDKQNVEKQYVVITKKAKSSEKTPGQWNTYDIVCKSDTIGVIVNGVLQNSGTKATDTSGWICLQSEGSPIEFRNIYIKPMH